MKKVFSILGLASFLAAGAVVPDFAASDNASQATTGTQTGSPQVATPATGSGSTVTSNQANQSYLLPLARPDRNNLMQQIPTALSHLAAAKTE